MAICAGATKVEALFDQELLNRSNSRTARAMTQQTATGGDSLEHMITGEQWVLKRATTRRLWTLRLLSWRLIIILLIGVRLTWTLSWTILRTPNHDSTPGSSFSLLPAFTAATGHFVTPDHGGAKGPLPPLLRARSWQNLRYVDPDESRGLLT